jgi:hypothetical protein
LQLRACDISVLDAKLHLSNASILQLLGNVIITGSHVELNVRNKPILGEAA